MRVILLSGGSGKRLWPLSNGVRSKLFLKLLPDESGNGGKQSMIQRVCSQLEEAGLLSATTIVAHENQAEITANQVGDKLSFIAEPYRRGTFTAVALAAAYLHDKLQVAPSETICVMPADIYVESAFFKQLMTFPEVLSQSGTNLALLGTTPSHPSSQYGYIVPHPIDGTAAVASSSEFLSIARFVEKPDEEVAAGLIDSHAMWNCGVFAFPLSFMLACLTNKGLPTGYEELLGCYEQLPEASFDVEVAETTAQAVVIPYDKGWKDLGDWRVFPDYFGGSVIGLGELTGDCMQSHIVNELDCPIHVIGVSNVIVAASTDGILVADKGKSNQIKQLLSGSEQPRSGEKRWGTYHILDHSKTDAASETLTKKIDMLPGKHTSYHLHASRQETWVILSGTGTFILEGVQAPIRSGNVLQIPAGAKHAVLAITRLEYMVIQIGTGLAEEDVRRIAVTWKDTIRLCTNG
ncbi:sugar phosphate nucleotidyltransferase [Paenibacillus sp. BC26]|uniref:sugar phosphate nucleotidyltransferase n=1 Tax=Paenibacillus sp. BC26 TaxID=1881032 RepID=UPI0008E05BC3|nr:sugar phosphate nucleotidyltransferase [Paenibacillus sp. BC26]SFT06571.1 mannose-1-phosphate guanylyltransferase [Paenibacillus sp. BC26]